MKRNRLYSWTLFNYEVTIKVGYGTIKFVSVTTTQHCRSLNSIGNIMGSATRIKLTPTCEMITNKCITRFWLKMLDAIHDYEFSLHPQLAIYSLVSYTRLLCLWWPEGTSDSTIIIRASSICSLIFDNTSEHSLLRYPDIGFSVLQRLSQLIARSLLICGQVNFMFCTIT